MEETLHRTRPRESRAGLRQVPGEARRGARAWSTCRPIDSGQQLELATREQLADMRARISFARIGLHQLTLSDDELIARLLRSTSINLTAEERRETIVLNAKSLLDVDADARFFAARILLELHLRRDAAVESGGRPAGLEGSASPSLSRLHSARDRARHGSTRGLAKFDLRRSPMRSIRLPICSSISSASRRFTIAISFTPTIR